MFSILNYDYDCTKKCKNVNHGSKITSSITKRGISDEALASYIAKICRNFTDVLDEEGRSALHLAVSVGNRYDLCVWLLRCGANLNLRDKESGHSPFTRAIYYGNVAEAILLQREGASLSPDNDFINPLQYCSRVKKPIDNDKKSENLVWGKNKNYNLGIGNIQGREIPEFIDFFRKNRLYIQQVSMNSYHTLFLSDGYVYVTGHGNGGRLGTGDELTLVTPKKVNIPFKDETERIVQISAGKNHSIALSNKNRLYATGLNTFCQLGIKSCTEKLLSFTEVPLNVSEPKKIFANDFSSMVVTNNDIYVCGTNFGQFGLKREVEKVPSPRKIAINGLNVERSRIELVDTSNVATIIYTESSVATNLLHIIYKYEMKAYKKPLMERIQSISCNSGGLTVDDRNKVVTKQDRPLRLIVLTELKNVFIWNENLEKFVRCSFAQNRYIEVDKMIWCKDDALASFMGNLYYAKIETHELKSKVLPIQGDYQETYVKKELSTDFKSVITLTRIPFIDKVVDFCTDPEGDNFAVLIENPKKYFSPPDLLEKTYNYSNLYEELSLCDNVHDLVFEIENQKIPAHKIVVCARCDYLKQLIHNENGKIVYLEELQELGLTANLFQLILRYIYTNQPILKTEIEELSKNYHQTLTMLKKVLSLLGLNELITAIKKNSEKCSTAFVPLQRSEYTELFDTTIKLASDREIRAHKCILMSRLEYFNMMFSHSWAETDTINLTNLSIDYMLPIIEFLYTNNVEEVRSGKYTDNYLFNMITICDQFFVEDLKSVFELIVSEKLSVKNCGEIYEFACTYNCEILKNCAMQFISLNFARVLEHRTLENVPPEMLKQINKFYRQFFGLEAYRTITPYSNAVTDQELDNFIRDFKIDLFTEPEEETSRQAKSGVKPKSTKPSRLSFEKRNYEREGILLTQDRSIEMDLPKNDEKKREINLELREISDKFEKEAKTWTKVSEKKDVNKKKVLASPKANQILLNESKVPSTFVCLTRQKTPEANTSPTVPEIQKTQDSSATRTLTFSLGDITPMKIKSKTSRRRNLSVNETSPSPHSEVVVSPVTPPNAWQINPVPDHMISPLDTTDLTKINTNIPKGKKKENCAKISSKQSSSHEQQMKQGAIKKEKASNEKSFSAIIEEEKREKAYIEKLRTKSLVLTQMEETAIEELRQFYNVDNISDETITVERKNYCDNAKFNPVWCNN